MEQLKVLRRGEDATGPGSSQSRKRRASAITVRIQKRTLGGDPLPLPQPAAVLTRAKDDPGATNRAFPETAGSLLIVQDPTEERQAPVRAARLAGLQVLQARNQEETLQILRERDFPVDLLLVIDHPSISSSAADLIRESLEIRPGLLVILMMDSGQREKMRAGYDAGAASILLHHISAEGFSTFLKQSLSAAREGRRRELRRRERRARHASDSLARRCLRKIRFWANAPSGSRRRTGLAAIAAGAVAFLIGMGLAYVLERSYRRSDQEDAMIKRGLEGMNRSKGPTDHRETAILYGQTLEQIGLTRETNEATRRYQQEHLQELRWQNYSRNIPPSEPVADPRPNRRANDGR